MAKSLTSHRPGLAVGLKLSAIFVFTILTALIKSTSGFVPPGEAVFFRSVFAIPVIVLWLALRGELRYGFETKHPWRHVWRGVLGTSAMGMTFAGLGMLPLPEVTAIGYGTPIFTLILAAIMLRERIRMIRITAVLMGLAGVGIMLWPRLAGGEGLQDTAALGAILILGATVMRALIQITVRQLVQTEHTAAIVFYFSITAAILSLMTLPFGWTFPDTDIFLRLGLAGVLGGIAQILVTSSYRFAPTSMLAPYDYSSMIFALFIGYIWFHELPTLVMMIGATFVIAGNILVIWREHQLGLERSKAGSAADPKA